MPKYISPRQTHLVLNIVWQLKYIDNGNYADILQGSKIGFFSET